MTNLPNFYQPIIFILVDLHTCKAVNLPTILGRNPVKFCASYMVLLTLAYIYSAMMQHIPSSSGCGAFSAPEIPTLEQRSVVQWDMLA